jgi:hypothetical protein
MGRYTDLRPSDFRAFVEKIAADAISIHRGSYLAEITSSPIHGYTCQQLRPIGAGTESHAQVNYALFGQPVNRAAMSAETLMAAGLDP